MMETTSGSHKPATTGHDTQPTWLPTQLPTTTESDFPPATKKIKTQEPAPSSLPLDLTATDAPTAEQAEEESGEEDPSILVDYF